MQQILIITENQKAYKYIFPEPLSIYKLSRLKRNPLFILVKNTDTNEVFNVTHDKFIKITNKREQRLMNCMFNRY